MADRVDTLKGFIDELLSLEVNTIIKPGMTATRQPNTAGTMVEILETYEEKLDQLATEGEKRERNCDRVDLARWKDLHAWATDLGDRYAKNGAHHVMVVRIRDNAAQIRQIFEKNPNAAFDVSARETKPDKDFALDDSQKIMLRKVWELGTEEVVMQTVIYLDGDVITRLQPRCYEDPEMRKVIEIHNQSVKTSIEFWGRLVDLVKTFVDAVAGVVGTKIGSTSGARDARDVH